MERVERWRVQPAARDFCRADRRARAALRAAFTRRARACDGLAGTSARARAAARRAHAQRRTGPVRARVAARPMDRSARAAARVARPDADRREPRRRGWLARARLRTARALWLARRARPRGSGRRLAIPARSARLRARLRVGRLRNGLCAACTRGAAVELARLRARDRPAWSRAGGQRGERARTRVALRRHVRVVPLRRALRVGRGTRGFVLRGARGRELARGARSLARWSRPRPRQPGLARPRRRPAVPLSSHRCAARGVRRVVARSSPRVERAAACACRSRLRRCRAAAQAMGRCSGERLSRAGARSRGAPAPLSARGAQSSSSASLRRNSWRSRSSTSEKRSAPPRNCSSAGSSTSCALCRACSSPNSAASASSASASASCAA